MRQLLDHAAENGYGLPAINVGNLSAISSVLDEGRALTRRARARGGR